jgi:hypothetical protein
MSNEITQAWSLCSCLILKHQESIIDNFIEHDGLEPKICGTILATHALCSNIMAPHTVYAHAIDIISSVEFQLFIKDYFLNYDPCYSILDEKFTRIYTKTLSLHPKSTPHKHSTLDIYTSTNEHILLGLRGGLYVSSSQLKNRKTLGELLLELYKINLERRV